MLNWHFPTLIIVLTTLTYNSYASVSEEFLIIFSSFFWLDAAGNLISASLTDSLVNMRAKLKTFFINVLLQKKNHLGVVFSLHNVRLTLVNEALLLFSIYSKQLFKLFFYKFVVFGFYLSGFVILVSLSEAVVSLFKRYFQVSSLFLS